MRLPVRMLVLALVVGGCRMRTAPTQVTFEPQSRAAARVAAPVEPSILSAHLVGKDGTPREADDALLLVFSHEVDAASIYATGFLVAFDEGSRVYPREAVLSPSNESDENRSVLLIGEFEDPEAGPLTDVMVVGSVYAENGAKLQGLVATVLPFATAPSVVLAQRLQPPAGACAGAAQAVRTYWIDGLRDVGRDDLARIDVILDDATTVHPVAFDDHQLDDQTAEDNVLDLCLEQDSPAQRVAIAAGLFTDPGGHQSAAVEEPIVSAELE